MANKNKKKTVKKNKLQQKVKVQKKSVKATKATKATKVAKKVQVQKKKQEEKKSPLKTQSKNKLKTSNRVKTETKAKIKTKEKIKPKLVAPKINQKLLVNFSPLDDRLVIEVVSQPKVTLGGIIIPDSVDEKPQAGRVIAAGPGHRNKKGKLKPVEVKVGDQVLFPRFVGNEVEYGGKKFLILREADLLGVSND